jgi:hypothetical protein
VDRVLKLSISNRQRRTKMSMPQEVSTLLEIIKALDLGALIPSAFTLALLWKLYGFFNGLSEKLTRIETKIDGLKELTPHLIKDYIEQRDKAKHETKPLKHNPSIEIGDFVQIIGIGFGISDLFMFLVAFIQGIIMSNHVLFWLIILITGIFGILPIFISKKTMSKNTLAGLSLISVIPWIYLILLAYGILPSVL